MGEIELLSFINSAKAKKKEHDAPFWVYLFRLFCVAIANDATSKAIELRYRHFKALGIQSIRHSHAHRIYREF